MRKLFTVLAVALAMTATAQKNAFDSNGFFDNWSVGINAGAQSDIHGLRSDLGYRGQVNPDVQSFESNPGSFWQRVRPTMGLEVTKAWSPIYATGIMANTAINSNPSHTVFDEWNVVLTNKINFSNLFCGYNGKPRFFEVEGVAAIGLGSHILNDYSDYEIDNGLVPVLNQSPVAGTAQLAQYGDNDHYFMSRLGLNFNFNLGNSKAWTISLKPAIVYNLDKETYHGKKNGGGISYKYEGAGFDINYAKAELMAGVTYHFKNRNGEHYFTNVKAGYSQAEIDAMNARINALKAQLDAKDADIARLNREIADLQKKLNDCLNRKPETKIVEKIVEKQGPDRSRLTTLVHFPINKTVIQPSQVPNVERVAAYLKNHKDATVVVEGWASIDGPADNNKRLSEGRAKAVKDMLISKYGIAANRIDARSIGNGILTEYSEPEWNRVSECTIVVKD
ncbi:OmpA family protein [Pseudoprevotella muciniphila]|uniref:OmpA family protein n=1 Tax=Pseudoprevotella muciniphila TaxID=2133944 RepID=A0A5P8E864_9BACT|nr:OmpA family protein [Pseudoprevotella muciniphila]QFQ13215.1 OmpA family protein [Pseudoprevotella muciniphila]